MIEDHGYAAPRNWTSMFRLGSVSLALLWAVSAPSYAQGQKPLIAVFSGAVSTIQNSEPLLTSNKARQERGLPLLENPDGTPLKFDALRPQRLAAPVTVYIEAFSAHPLEADMQELYAPPDGYVDRQTGAFSTQRNSAEDIPVYEATLRPEDGLYLLPYMARQANGQPWDQACAYPGAPLDECRLTFYPDASRMFEEIDRFGIAARQSPANNLLNSKADFHFYRAAPPGGYRKGLPASRRTDFGEGDIQKEVWGEDFFTYLPTQEPAMPALARLTNVVQHAMATGVYAGGIWLEGSPFAEETIYWLGLLIDTTVPISANAAQRTNGSLGSDGPPNIVDSVSYILSDVWKDEMGLDRIGAVMIQEEQIFTAREIQKGDDRPGGYVATGGHGGIIGSTNPLALTFIPPKKHTHTSAVNMTRLPDTVPGVRQVDGRITTISVPIKDDAGNLLATAIPKVTITSYGRYMSETFDDDPSGEVEIAARITKNLQDFPLAGIVLPGWVPYASANEQQMLALQRAALRGMPVARVGRGNHEGLTRVNSQDLFIEGENLTASKARLLLMASLMKLGSLPVPADPDRPTPTELRAIREKVAQYQEIFSTH